MEAVGVEVDHNGHVTAKVNGTFVNFLVGSNRDDQICTP